MHRTEDTAPHMCRLMWLLELSDRFLKMKTDHRYRNVEVCLNFPTVEDIAVKWLEKIIMNHDGISKNRSNWLVTIGQL